MKKLSIMALLFSICSYASEVSSNPPSGMMSEYRIQDCFDIHINNNDAPENISYMVMKGSQVLTSGNISKNDSTIKFCDSDPFTMELDQVVPLTNNRKYNSLSYKLILDGLILDKKFNSRVAAAINVSHEYKFSDTSLGINDQVFLGPGVDSIDYNIEGPHFMFPRGNEYVFETDSIYYADTVKDHDSGTDSYAYGNIGLNNNRSPMGYISVKMFNVSEVHKLNLNLPAELFIDAGDAFSFNSTKLEYHRDIDFVQHSDDDTIKFFERKLPYLETANLIDHLDLSVSYDPNHLLCSGLLYNKYSNELSGYCISGLDKYVFNPNIKIQRILLPLGSCPNHKVKIIDVGKTMQSIQCD